MLHRVHGGHLEVLAKLATLRAIAAEPAAPGEQLPRMTQRQGLIGTEAQLRWAESALPELRARAAARRRQAASPSAPA